MKKILIGMSGGVDSSVSALLLKNEGYEVIGATMVLFDSDEIEEGCLSNKAVEDAKIVCEQLGIEHHIIDLKKDFKKYVINNFIECYKSGQTPNPCVQCNKHLKFGVLYDKAKELGCEYISTGHYASVRDSKLVKSKAHAKDQTYFLYGIKKEILPMLVFPLEHYNSKDEIRKIASDNNLYVAAKKESQEICFIPSDDYKNFLQDNIKETIKKGNFVDKEGNILGEHNGIMYYTIGQRKGLGISSKNPLYVINIIKKNNTIVLGDKDDLFKHELIAKQINLLVSDLPKKCMAKIRYRTKEEEAELEVIDKDTIKVKFTNPQRAITRGQSVVFYEGDVCLGGGIIHE